MRNGFLYGAAALAIVAPLTLASGAQAQAT